MPIPNCFDSCSFLVLSDVWEGYGSCFVLLLQDYFGNSDLCWFHMNFRILCSISVKNAMGNLMEFTLNLGCFG